MSKTTDISDRTAKLIKRQEGLRERQAPPTEKRRCDYKPCDYVVENAELTFELDRDVTTVFSTLTIRAAHANAGALRLDGENLELHDITLDSQPLNDEFEFGPNDDPHCIIIKGDCCPKDRNFTLKFKNIIWPKDNNCLSGLYESSGLLTTQCEAEGFRRITYSLDRPDVMAKYKVTLIANKELYPVLLSNGNRIKHDENLGEGRHSATFEDPFPKPSYLFALVAGKLECLNGNFTTCEGKKVELNLYALGRSFSKLNWALECVKTAMEWDEKRFDRVYDLDVYSIVCCDDFNQGAMENKSLNIFNSSCLLASRDMSSDADMKGVEACVGHEYFHNWTGNRVTLRDWFQLCVKEALTNYREQEFSMRVSPVVRRIEDVAYIRSIQFAEDAGAMSHSVRPDSVVVQDNFYTATIYHKGSEVIRMFATILGTEGFKKGMNLYFNRFDGKAVTCRDFMDVMAEANNVDLNQMETWFSQKGTPTVNVVEACLDKEKSVYKLTLEQLLPAHTAPSGQSIVPYCIPVRIGLIGKESKKDIVPEKVLLLKEMRQTFTFDNVTEDVVFSMLRGFSAPVKSTTNLADEDTAFIMAYDSDGFNRWDACQSFLKKALFEHIRLIQQGKDAVETCKTDSVMIQAFSNLLADATSEDKAEFVARCIMLPPTRSILLEMEPRDPRAVAAARLCIRRKVVAALSDPLMKVYETLTKELRKEGYVYSQKQIGYRNMKQACLNYLCVKGASLDKAKFDPEFSLQNAFDNATCMTEKEGALALVCSIDDCPGRDKIIREFYETNKDEPIAVDKWFRAQALMERDDAIERCEQLMEHEGIKDSKNPDRLRSFYSCLAANLPIFHRQDGKAYTMIADAILATDKFNPSYAAGLFRSSFMDFAKYTPALVEMMKKQVLRIKETKISPSLYEMVDKSMNSCA